MSDAPPPLPSSAPGAKTGSDAVLERLLTLHPKVIDLSLERMERLLAALGNPEKDLPPVIHVAGTNGKGSAIAFLRAMLEAQGLTVHVYTSPHLVRFHERIRVAGKLIEEDALQALLEECEARNGGAPITFFEITTAAAFFAFARTAADVTLLEVGLGGRLDATNVIDRPLATVITPVGLDHQQFLGETIEEIAGEKAGILKRGVPAIIGPQPDAALATIADAAARVRARPAFFGQEWMAFEQHSRMVYQDEQGLLDLPLPALPGRHQIANAGTAIAVLRHQSRFEISDKALEAGLREASWPARLQRLKRGPLIEWLGAEAELWLDGGHNGHAGRALAETMADFEERAPRPLILVLGMLKNKDPEAFLAPFRGLAHHVVCVPIPGEEASADAETLAAAAEAAGLDATTASSVEDAVAGIAHSVGPNTRVLICGSLYLAGQVLSFNR